MKRMTARTHSSAFAVFCLVPSLLLAACSALPSTAATNSRSLWTATHPRATMPSQIASAPTETPIPVATTTPATVVATPQPGTANTAGRVLWNNQPVTGIEVKLCDEYAAYSSDGCAGTQSSTKTDEQGSYAFANVPPGQYVVLVHSVDTDGWFSFRALDPNNGPFAPFDIDASPAKFDLTVDQTLMLGDLNIYRFDLMQTFPPNGEYYQDNPSLTWEAYPGAAYYEVRFSRKLFPDGRAERVNGSTLSIPGSLQNCEYGWEVEAFNLEGIKIAESGGASERFNMSGQPSSCLMVLIDPLDQDVLGEGEAFELSWRTSSPATYYDLYVYGESIGAELYGVRVDATTHALPQGLPAGEYTWRVNAYENDRWVAQSDSHSFTVLGHGHAPASIPTIVLPTDVPMAIIPAGLFQIGSDNDRYPADDEKPIHTVTLDAFTIDVYEVTNARYAQCVADGQCQPPDHRFSSTSGGSNYSYYGTPQYADNPVIHVSWYDAKAYCAWVGKRLPTEAEWEKAARGGLAGKLYPWGNELSVCTPGASNGAQTGACTPKDTVAVGTFAPNGYGLFDMTGNVAEWVNDWYQSDYYSISPGSNPLGPDTGTTKVQRGGGWDNSASRYNDIALRVAARGGYYHAPADSSGEAGFRCAAPP